MQKFKIIALFLTAEMLLLNAGCADSQSAESLASTGVSETALQNDTVKPRLKIKSSESSVRINQGDEYHLMSGVTGSDNVDGDITSKIQVDKGGYDPAIPGEYMITYTLSDSSGNEADPVKRTIVVKDTTIFTAPPVYTDAIEGEKLNPENPALFGGAWYH